MKLWRVTMRSFSTWSNTMLRQVEGWEARVRRSWYNASAAVTSFMYGTPTERPAQIPFMITADMKQQLADLGYKQDEVRHLTPLQAVDIITAGRPPVPRPVSSAATSSSTTTSSPEVALDASGRARESATTILLYGLALAAPRATAAPSSPSPSATTTTPPPSSASTTTQTTNHVRTVPTPNNITAIALTGLPPS